jgi:hypothetical protein
MFSPLKLKEHGIEFTTVLHEAGEFMITFPGAYHAGFNHGLNIAESTNFATTRWFDIGSRAKRCICRPHSVNIDVSLLETLYLRIERMAGRNVSSFHSNDNMTTISRRYRCICGMNDIFKVEIDTPPSIHCEKCSLWGHTLCYNNQDQPEEGYEYNTHICYVCSRIESELHELTSNLSSEVLVPEDQPLTEYKRITKCLNSTPTKSPVKISEEMKIKKKRKSPIKLTTIEISIGDTVSMQIGDGAIIGTISDIEDGLGRLHVKGTKRDTDLWSELSGCLIIEKKNKSKIQRQENTTDTSPSPADHKVEKKSPFDSSRLGPVNPANLTGTGDDQFLDTTRLNKSSLLKDIDVLNSRNASIDIPKVELKKFKIESPSKASPMIVNNLAHTDCIIKPIRNDKTDFSVSSVCIKGSEINPVSKNLVSGKFTEILCIPVVSVELCTPLPLPDQLFAFHKENLIYALQKMKSAEVLPWLIDSIFPLCSPVLRGIHTDVHIYIECT